MEQSSYLLEKATPFSESVFWDINRRYYEEQGIEAWRQGIVPLHLTSNAFVGKTYANLIFSFLKDLGQQGATEETVYLLELGAGHGRLAFHILFQLEALLEESILDIPPYCYILSDIAEDSLQFFLDHPQLQPFFQEGKLDCAFFDALENEEIQLRKSQKTIKKGELSQPLITIANYFFDSIPNDLYYLYNGDLSTCSISLTTPQDPDKMDASELLENMIPEYHYQGVKKVNYPHAIWNEILTAYQGQLVQTHLFFPHRGMQCLHNLEGLSQRGMMVLSMDKGFHEIHDLENEKAPELIAHGSCSIWVNYHALSAYCEKRGGQSLLPDSSTFNLELACLLFLPDAEKFEETKATYQSCVNDFGPDDFNRIKKFIYKNAQELSLQDLIAFLRLSAYDSTFFIRLLPQIKLMAQRISHNERQRLGETIHKVWNGYYNLGESLDLAYELGGMLYDLGYFEVALDYFGYSNQQLGVQADVLYNQALCYYQLRKDGDFIKTLNTGKLMFPDHPKLAELERLDLNSN